MRKLYRFLMTLVALLVTTGSMATVYISGTVSYSDLKVGDIIGSNVKITNTDYSPENPNYKRIHFIANRWGSDGQIRNSDNYTDIYDALYLDSEAKIYSWYTPYTASGVIGNAWQVEYIYGEEYGEWQRGIYVGGIKYDFGEVDVIFNDTKTEAKFDMPDEDATLDYEVARDLAYKTDIHVKIDGTPTTRIRVVKDENGFYKFDRKWWQYEAVDTLDSKNPISLTNGQLVYSFKRKDGDEYVDPYEYNPSVGYWEENLKPGIWRLEAHGNDNYTGDMPYEGFIYSQDIVLYEGYEVVVPAGEYITYYKDEALKVEDADAQLYTITQVAQETATATELAVAAANTPILVKNNASETKSFLLIPTTEAATAVTVADEFLGTLTDKTFTAAETSAANYYVCTGREFVKVKGAGTLGANKAYLKVGGTQAAGAPRLVIRFGGNGEGTTGIDGINADDSEAGDWYDLNGRKLEGKPAQKGVYIKNGKKIVVK